MKVNNSSIVLNDLPELNASVLTLGEKVSARVLKNLGGGHYLINLKNSKVKVHSDIPLKDTELFVVTEKSGGRIVLKPELAGKVFTVKNLISGYASLSKIENPLVNQIVYLMLKKNIRIKEENVLRIYNSILKSGIKSSLNSFILRFLINLSENGVLITPGLIKKLIEYKVFLDNKKHKFKKMQKSKDLSDNKKEGIFSREDKDYLSGFIKNVNGFMSSGDFSGGYYFLFPFLSEEEYFYSEIKFFYERNETGGKDYIFSANIHLNTGEVKLRGSCINLYVYLKLYFENENMLKLCKSDFNENLTKRNFVQSIDLFPLNEYNFEDGVLFSDIYFKDEEIEYG